MGAQRTFLWHVYEEKRAGIMKLEITIVFFTLTECQGMGLEGILPIVENDV